tara:strand:- start:4006 stop:4188 length:183 start_codon:yes stop_codon:yes gene_type:complete
MSRKKFTIETISVEGNKVMNLPRERRHTHLWVEYAGGIRCSDCKERRSGYIENLIPKQAN